MSFLEKLIKVTYNTNNTIKLYIYIYKYGYITYFGNTKQFLIVSKTQVDRKYKLVAL